MDVLTSLSVPINGVLTPFKQVIHSIQRFCKPLLFHTGHDIFDIAFSGSSFLMKVGAENTLVCTQHQFKTPNGPPFSADMVVTPVSVDGVMFGATPISARFPQLSDTRDRTWDDIIAIKFEAGTEDPNIDNLFLELDWQRLRTLTGMDLSKIVSIFAIGFPTSSTDYDPIYDGDDAPVGVSVKSRWVVVFLAPIGRAFFDFETRIQLVQHPHYKLQLKNPDGMSGSPVFFIYFDNFRKLQLGFAGMITDIRNGVYQVYDGNNVRNFLYGRRL